MIPLKITLKNFISYGPISQTINFEPYNLICLSGKNGHGKSAIFDAITWAIWGQARKGFGTSKPDEGLLHLGESHMSVNLDFICNNIHYKINREFGYESKKLIAILEFGILDQVTGEYKPLTDKTIKLTQNKIESLIGLSFESFVNSAFLRQGQSNEFSKKSPSDRKEVIAEILGLNKLENLKKVAYEKAKEANTLKSSYSNQIDNISIELEKRVDIQAKAFEINDNLQYSIKQESHLANQLNNLKSSIEFTLKKKTEADQIRFQINHNNSIINTNTSEIINNFKTYRLIKKQKNNLVDLTKLEENKTLLQKELALLNEKANLYFHSEESIKSKIVLLENYKNQKNIELSKELKILQSTYLNLLTQKDKLIDQNKKDIKELKKIETDIQTIDSINTINPDIILSTQNQLEKRKNYLNKYITLKNILSSELEESKLNLSLLQESHKSDCPTCKQSLDQDIKSNLLSNLTIKNNFLNHRISFLDNILKKLKLIITEQNNQLVNLQKRSEDLKIKQIQKIELKKLATKIELSCSKYNTDILAVNSHLEANINQTEAIKSSKNTDDLLSQQLNSEIQSLSDILKNLDISNIKSEIQKISADINNITIILNSYNELTKEIALQEQRRNNISKLISSTKAVKSQQKILTSKLAEENYDTSLKLLSEQKNLLTKELSQLSKSKEELILQKGSLDQQVTFLDKRHKTLLEFKEKLQKITNDFEEYAILSNAFGKDGIQAILIENALPEIEIEANNILSKLTNNQSQIYIESQKDLRSGKTKETLDIKIIDPHGTRPYEVFSGGEAFRIDFSLRIAISKLLARRSGTPLQTLIIDEGFGSQDEEGLSYIMDAIHKIQEDFSKVIIISHLPTIKEQFPVHFLVHKTAYGSAIKVIEQG